MRTTFRQRGICPACRREYDVTASGVMRHHWSPENQRKRFGWDCPGVGQEPHRLLVNPIEEAERQGFRKAIACLRTEAKRLLEVAPNSPYFDEFDRAADYLEASADDLP